ncbi:hypothetical protein LVD15_03410 [Fulvivirga maritima]|uniref:hypothetical protein n=1 Tax=Fulvivirga maritima TaxID=2904247 RepID=UPI001F3A26B3|nr:hypothetical protein [Fulvivirga maritima]UII27493.1 hypothetical protein LVD15_03410 [Fulvivirga maritima]
MNRLKSIFMLFLIAYVISGFTNPDGAIGDQDKNFKVKVNGDEVRGVVQPKSFNTIFIQKSHS